MQTAPDKMTYFGTISLGGLIALLKRRPKDQEVKYDFGYFHPTSVDSYRGYYDHLALGYSEDGDAPTVATVLALLEYANGKTFGGYKGGDFEMGPDTPVWVANYSQCPSTVIVGILDDEHSTILATSSYD